MIGSLGGLHYGFIVVSVVTSETMLEWWELGGLHCQIVGLL